MITVHHKHTLGEQHQSRKSKTEDDLHEELPPVLVLTTSEEAIEFSNLSQTTFVSESLSIESLLSHYIPSSNLCIEDEMSRWSQGSDGPEYLAESDRFALTSAPKQNSLAMYYERSNMPSRDSFHGEKVNCATGSEKDSVPWTRPLPPPSLELKRSKRKPSALQYLTSPSQINEGKRTNLERFHFDFNATTDSTSNVSSSHLHHSPLPSLSYSITSSPPATPPTHFDSPEGVEHDTRLHAGSYGRRPSLSPPSSPPLTSPPPPTPALPNSTATTCRRSIESKVPNLGPGAHRNIPVTTAVRTPVRAANVSSISETSFMDWDDSNSRLAKMKKSIIDLRLANNSMATPSKHQKNTSSHHTVPSTAGDETDKTGKLGKFKNLWERVIKRGDD